jgi:EpsI family protein
MTIKRLVSLQSFLLLGLGSVVLVPKDISTQPAAIGLHLPEVVAGWRGADESISQGERDSLGPDTQFARKIYTNMAGDQIFASVVLSGPDMNTSIHRPERCLPAQGWTIVDSRTVSLLAGKRALKATRLHNIRNVRLDNGRALTINSVDYYWFVGHSDTTPSHLQRTLIDIRDRILKGKNQQWAYITIAANVTGDYKIAGRSEKETDELVRSFIEDFVPNMQSASVASNN